MVYLLFAQWAYLFYFYVFNQEHENSGLYFSLPSLGCSFVCLAERRTWRKSLPKCVISWSATLVTKQVLPGHSWAVQVLVGGQEGARSV